MSTTRGRPRAPLHLYAMTTRSDLRVSREAKAVERQELARKAIRMRLPAATVIALFGLSQTAYQRLETQEGTR